MIFLLVFYGMGWMELESVSREICQAFGGLGYFGNGTLKMNGSLGSNLCTDIRFRQG